jgi:hypothetical protein
VHYIIRMYGMAADREIGTWNIRIRNIEKTIDR